MVREINIIAKVILDFAIILLVALPILLFFLIGTPYQRGFYCNDETIRYPYKPSTISNNALYCFGIFVPVALIIIVESVQYSISTPRQRNSYTFLKWQINPLVWELYKRVGVFAFGGCLSQLATDIAKYSIGRLRPHFINVCQPNVNCSDPNMMFIYHVDITCTNQEYSSHLLKESRLSFLSGHSSFSAYAMLYLALYFQFRMTYTEVRLLRPLLQAGFIYVAWYTALSRVSDYKHHWNDVLAGSFLGSVVALLVVFFVSDLLPKKKKCANLIEVETGRQCLTTETNNQETKFEQQSNF